MLEKKDYDEGNLVANVILKWQELHSLSKGIDFLLNFCNLIFIKRGNIMYERIIFYGRKFKDYYSINSESLSEPKNESLLRVYLGKLEERIRIIKDAKELDKEISVNLSYLETLFERLGEECELRKFFVKREEGFYEVSNLFMQYTEIGKSEIFALARNKGLNPKIALKEIYLEAVLREISELEKICGL